MKNSTRPARISLWVHTLYTYFIARFYDGIRTVNIARWGHNNRKVFVLSERNSTTAFFVNIIKRDASRVELGYPACGRRAPPPHRMDRLRRENNGQTKRRIRIYNRVKRYTFFSLRPHARNSLSHYEKCFQKNKIILSRLWRDLAGPTYTGPGGGGWWCVGLRGFVGWSDREKKTNGV